ncbi:M56 family metallopeptidase [Paenibacillus beijingensis]|uniref:Peptidase M56 domain-containing protein n=1 Tax=Paenibacillus beijingensis TaxID=1126833 RepID=A0A0D5NHU9_9BACL|nr:M56 family metallopeptidase [Paenibacillus beijingensis]AJY74670.1 hypothetical protein VN24_08865 [Paenibacillus beijingensis]
MWESKSRLLLVLGLALPGFIALEMMIYTADMLTGWKMNRNLIHMCAATLMDLGLSALVKALNLLVFVTLLVLLWQSARQPLLARRAGRKLQAMLEPALTEEMNRRYGSGRSGILVIDREEPAAFTMGMLKPRIVISTGLMSLLEPRELEAVILHETYHQKHGDPRNLFLLSLFASVFWYIPLLGWLCHQYKIVREVLADNEAMSRQGTAADLAGALLKMLKRGGAEPPSFAHVSFAETSINCRIRLILNPDEQLPLQLPLKRTMISLPALVALGAMFFGVLN